MTIDNDDWTELERNRADADAAVRAMLPEFRDRLRYFAAWSLGGRRGLADALSADGVESDDAIQGLAARWHADWARVAIAAASYTSERARLEGRTAELRTLSRAAASSDAALQSAMLTAWIDADEPAKAAELLAGHPGWFGPWTDDGPDGIRRCFREPDGDLAETAAALFQKAGGVVVRAELDRIAGPGWWNRHDADDDQS